MFNFDDQTAHKSFIVNTSLDVRFLELIVTPNPCPRHVCLINVCDNLLTKEIHVTDHCWKIPMDRMLLIGKNFTNEGF